MSWSCRDGRSGPRREPCSGHEVDRGGRGAKTEARTPEYHRLPSVGTSMSERVRPGALLPRLVAEPRRRAALWNGGGLLATGLSGAGLVHVLAYHIPLSVPPGERWVATAAALLAACPLLGPLGGITAIAAGATLVALWEVRCLQYLDTTLRRRLGESPPRNGRAVLVSAREVAVPRSPWRLAGLTGFVLALQWVLLVGLGILWPMRMHMVMHGVPMAMTMTTTLPLGPLHLLVAAGLGWLLWRVEHRLTCLRSRVDHKLRLLARIGGTTAAHPPLDRHGPPLRAWWGSVLFARPPPRPC
jgi:hypothetical protein